MAIADIRNIEVCFSPQLAGFIATSDEAVVVVVDILRATTSMVSALANGARFIIPVSSLEKAKKMKAGGYTVAAERDGNILDFADFGNSAFEFMDGSIKDRQLVFSTTNGTVAVETARKFGTVVLGAFSNITALAHWIVEQKKNVIVLCCSVPVGKIPFVSKTPFSPAHWPKSCFSSGNTTSTAIPRMLQSICGRLQKMILSVMLKKHFIANALGNWERTMYWNSPFKTIPAMLCQSW